MKKVAFCTLGCKVNQYETRAMGELFELGGYEVVNFEEKSDVYVINTCSVTAMSDRKSRQMIRRAKKANKDGVVIVTGCYAQTASDEVLKIDGVNLVIGTSGRENIVKMADSLLCIDKTNAVCDIMKVHSFENLSVSSYDERTRAYVKAQEGCSQFCSYCIIPYARGPIRSRNADDVINEAKRLADAGFEEIVLVGIHIASYGRDIKSFGLSHIIDEIDKIEKIKRIRLSSIEPMYLDDEFINTVKNSKKLCRHFHISLQSGCDETLKRMNRRYTSRDFENIVSGLRAAFDDVAITTDIMVGFPGESEEEFKKSYDFAKKISFADAHIFQYSPRKGTPAAVMENQVSPDKKHERSEKMIALTAQCRKEFLERFQGKRLEVLFEQPYGKKGDMYEGKTDNYITVAAPSDKNLEKQFKTVRITGSDGEVLFGEIEE